MHLLYKPHLKTWKLNFGPFGQIRAIRKNLRCNFSIFPGHFFQIFFENISVSALKSCYEKWVATIWIECMRISSFIDQLYKELEWHPKKTSLSDLKEVEYFYAQVRHFLPQKSKQMGFSIHTFAAWTVTYTIIEWYINRKPIKHKSKKLIVKKTIILTSHNKIRVLNFKLNT